MTDTAEIEKSMEILVVLGGSSGRDSVKISKLRTTAGVTGVPILLHANSYVECRVTGSLDNDENTIFAAYADAGVTWMTIEPASRSFSDFRIDVDALASQLVHR